MTAVDAAKLRRLYAAVVEVLQRHLGDGRTSGATDLIELLGWLSL